MTWAREARQEAVEFMEQRRRPDTMQPDADPLREAALAAPCPVHPGCGCAPASPEPCACPPLTPFLRERIEDARQALLDEVALLRWHLWLAHGHDTSGGTPDEPGPWYCDACRVDFRSAPVGEIEGSFFEQSALRARGAGR